MYGGQRTSSGSWFSLPMWISGLSNKYLYLSHLGCLLRDARDVIQRCWNRLIVLLLIILSPKRPTWDIMRKRLRCIFCCLHFSFVYFALFCLFVLGFCLFLRQSHYRIFLFPTPFCLSWDKVYCVALTDLELKILLPQLSECLCYWLCIAQSRYLNWNPPHSLHCIQVRVELHLIFIFQMIKKLKGTLEYNCKRIRIFPGVTSPL